MDRFQKKKIEEWSLIVSLPLALASILSIVLPPAILAIKGDYSELKVTLAKSTFQKMELLITNTGNQPAIINRVVLDASEGKYTDVTLFKVFDQQRIVKPKENLFFVAANGGLIHTSVDLFRSKTDLPTKNCRAVIEYQQFDSKPEKSEYKFRCYYVDHEASSIYSNLIVRKKEAPVGQMVINENGSEIVVDSELVKRLLKVPAETGSNKANSELQREEQHVVPP